MQQVLSMRNRGGNPLGRLPHYVYGLFDPKTGSYFYVGLTANTLENRLYAHMFLANNPKLKQTLVSQFIIERKIIPEIHLLEVCKGKQVGLKAERKWICDMESNGIRLINKLKKFLNVKPK